VGNNRRTTYFTYTTYSPYLQFPGLVVITSPTSPITAAFTKKPSPNLARP
jgi:hypothetical protein